MKKQKTLMVTVLVFAFAFTATAAFASMTFTSGIISSTGDIRVSPVGALRPSRTSPAGVSPVFIVEDSADTNHQASVILLTMSGSSNISSAIGQEISPLNDNTATTSEFSTTVVRGVTNASTGTITDAEGILVVDSQNFTSGSIVNDYGLKIQDIAVGTNNYAIQTGLGAVDLGDSIILSNHVNTHASDNDYDGSIAISSATSASHTFDTVFNSAPACTLTPTGNPGGLFYWVSTSTTAVTANISSSGSLTFYYHCVGNPN